MSELHSFSWLSDIPGCGWSHCVCLLTCFIGHCHLWLSPIICRVLHLCARSCCLLKPLFTGHFCSPSDATTSHPLGREEGCDPRYFWSHLPFFPNCRKQVKNKIGCHALPCPAGWEFCSQKGPPCWKVARNIYVHPKQMGHRLVPTPKLAGHCHFVARRQESKCLSDARVDLSFTLVALGPCST